MSSYWHRRPMRPIHQFIPPLPPISTSFGYHEAVGGGLMKGAGGGGLKVYRFYPLYPCSCGAHRRPTCLLDRGGRMMVHSCGTAVAVEDDGSGVEEVVDDDDVEEAVAVGDGVAVDATSQTC